MDYRVMACAFATHRDLGRNCEEEIYRNDLIERLDEAGLGLSLSEVLVRVRHGEFVKDYSLDLVVGERGIYELKVAKAIATEHEGQTLNYLLLTDCSHGKVVNFLSSSVESRFVNNPLTRQDRCRFSVSEYAWRGPNSLKCGVMAAVEDLGLFLETALYNQILVHCSGGPEVAMQSQPITRGGRILGRQVFQMCAVEEAFRVTSLTSRLAAQEASFMKLLRLTQLKAIHWINLNRHTIQLKTLTL